MEKKKNQFCIREHKHRIPNLHQNHSAPYPSSKQGEKTNEILQSRLTEGSWLPKTLLCKESCCLLTLVWLLQKSLIKPQEEEGEAPPAPAQPVQGRKEEEDTPQPISRFSPSSTRCTRAPSSVQPGHRSAASSLLCSCRLKNKPETNNPHPPRHRFPLAQKSALPRANFHASIPTITLAANLIGKKRAPEV